METQNLVVCYKKDPVPARGLRFLQFKSRPEIKPLYDIKSEVAAFKETNKEYLFMDDVTLFREEIYPEKTGVEKKMYRTYTITCGSVDEAVSLYHLLENDEHIEYVQFDEMNELCFTPNDPLFDTQWGLSAIQCSPAWSLSQGDDIVVAVLDTGVDAMHPDISTNMWQNANGEFGFNFSGDNANTADDDGHGTHVAGIIAATINNNTGIAGVAPKAKIMAVKIFPNALYSVCCKAIKYAVDNGAKVLNNSWGSSIPNPSNPVLEDAVRYAASKGAIVVFAAGNNNMDLQLFSPANQTNTVISVGATGRNDFRSHFSNFGTGVTVAAPGEDILSLLFNTQQYVSKEGTSMAAAHVSGLVALMLKVNPQLDFATIKNLLQNNGDMVKLNGIFAKPFATSRINVQKTVTAAIPLPNVTGVAITFHVTAGSKTPNEEMQLTLLKKNQPIGNIVFGWGDVWSSSDSHSCTMPVTPFDISELQEVKIKLVKTHYPPNSASALEGWIEGRVICSGNTRQQWFSTPEKKYDDGNPLDVVFP
jgi:thermitase